MNITDARKIAETITNQQLKEMFDNAKLKVKDWTSVSIVNKTCTKGAAWNILARGFDLNAKHHVIAKTNMIREFGEFLAPDLQPQKSGRSSINKPLIHQDPIF